VAGIGCREHDGAVFGTGFQCRHAFAHFRGQSSECLAV
jgi:hypothetical protein